jgi:DNA ligase-associated metallophosphoesterase
MRADRIDIMPLRDQRIDVQGISLHADVGGALVDDDDRALIVADLHLEKGSAYARRGQMLPPFDTAATLARLAALIMRHRPRLVVALGDSFHDRFGYSRMAPGDRDALSALQAGRDWIWISGNHDPVLPDAAGGERHAEIHLGPLVLRHEPSKDAQGEIAGHFHPVARIAGQRRRCFVNDGQRLVMPAFGAYAGGLNLHDTAIASLFRGRRVAHVMARDRVYAVCASRCMPD